MGGMTKTIIVTGASDGIGAAAASQLAAQGHRVVAVGRSPEKTAAVAQRLGIESQVADFAELDQVERLADRLLASCDRIDVLANNAGGSFGADRIETVDGHELTWQVNYLAPWYLTWLLLPRLIASGGLVINTSSAAHRAGRLRPDGTVPDDRHTAMRAYANSKLAQVLHVVELQRRFGPQGLAAVALHPGAVGSSFGSGYDDVVGRFYAAAGRFMASPERGADTLVWLAQGRPGINYPAGRFFANRSVSGTHRLAGDPVAASLLWHDTEVSLAERIRTATAARSND